MDDEQESENAVKGAARDLAERSEILIREAFVVMNTRAKVHGQDVSAEVIERAVAEAVNVMTDGISAGIRLIVNTMATDAMEAFRADVREATAGVGGTLTLMVVDGEVSGVMGGLHFERKPDSRLVATGVMLEIMKEAVSTLEKQVFLDAKEQAEKDTPAVDLSPIPDVFTQAWGAGDQEASDDADDDAD